MDESLKAINLIHQVIVGISAAILAFALTPNPDYSAALRDLTVLRQLSFKDYDRFAAAIVPDNGGSEDYRSALSRAGYTTESNTFFVPRQVFIKRPDDASLLATVAEFFRDNNQLIYRKFDPSSLKFLHSLEYRKQTYLVNLKLCAPRRMVFPNADGLPPPNFGAQDAGVLLSEPPRSGVSNVFISFATSEGDMNCLLSMPATINSIPVDISGKQAQEWLRSKGIEPKSWLRNLDKLSDQIGSKSLADASRFLEDKVNAPKREVSFLGITVPEETASWVGPTLMVLLMLIFLSHVRHVKSIATSSDTSLKIFPWIGLFMDRLSKLLTYGSITVLPILSNLLLVSRPWQSTGRMTDVGKIGAGISFAALIVSVLTGLEIYALSSLRTVWDKEAEESARRENETVEEGLS